MRQVRWLWLDAVTASGELDHIAWSVAHALSRYMSSSGHARPSRLRLAHDSRLALRSVDKGIEDLEAGGWLHVTRARGRGHTNRYLALVDDTPEKANDVHHLEGEKVHQVPLKGAPGAHEQGLNQETTRTREEQRPATAAYKPFRPDTPTSQTLPVDQALELARQLAGDVHHTKLGSTTQRPRATALTSHGSPNPGPARRRGCRESSTLTTARGAAPRTRSEANR